MEDNSALLDFSNTSTLIGVFASIFAILGVIIAFFEFYKRTAQSLSVKFDLGNLYNPIEDKAYFTLSATINNRSSFKINMHNISISTKEGLPSLGFMNFGKTFNEINNGKDIDARTIQSVYFFLNPKIIKEIIANNDVSNSKLKKRIYMTIETASKKYKYKTPYTIKDLFVQYELHTIDDDSKKTSTEAKTDKR